MRPEDRDLITTQLRAAEVGLLAAARHEALNHLDICQENLLAVHRSLDEDRAKDRHRLNMASESARAVAQIFSSPLFRPPRMRENIPFELAASLDEAIALLAGRIETLGIQIESKVNLTLETDPDATMMVLVQLLINSVNAFSLTRRRTPGPTIRVVGEWADESSCRVEYSDNRPDAASPADSQDDLGFRIAHDLLEGMGGAMAPLPRSTGAAFELRLPAVKPTPGDGRA